MPSAEFDKLELRQILQRLDRFDGIFPRFEVQAAVARRDEITPELLRILEDATRDPQRWLEEDHFAHRYALFLLAQFREPRAYPLIVRFFSLPGEISLDLTGDTVVEDLDNILASVSCGDMSGMMALIENDQVNEYVRSAALRALIALVICGLRTREEVMSYFASLFHGGLARTPHFVWDKLVCMCTDLWPGEVLAEIRQACQEDLVEPGVIGLEELEQKVALGKEEALARLAKDSRYHLITDTVWEMESWSCFRQTWRTKHRQKYRALPSPKAQPKAGRNQPCPCGSGKKYKKCCGF